MKDGSGIKEKFQEVSQFLRWMKNKCMGIKSLPEDYSKFLTRRPGLNVAEKLSECFDWRKTSNNNKTEEIRLKIESKY